MNFSGAGLPTDMSLEALKIQRRQAMIDAMVKQSMTASPLQTAGGYTVRGSPLEGIARLASGYFARKGQEDVDQSMSALGTKYNDRLAQGIKQYMATKAGTPGSSELIVDEQQESSNVPLPDGTQQRELITAPGVAGKPVDAAIGAMTSGLAPLQKLGELDLSTMNKAQMTPKDILTLQGFDPKTRVQAATMLSQGVPMAQVLSLLGPEKKLLQHDGHVADFSGDTPRPVGELGSKTIPPNWASQLPPNTQRAASDPPGVFRMKGPDNQWDVYQANFSGGKLTDYKKLDNAPRVTVDARSTVHNAGPKKGAEVIFSEAAKTVKELGDQARSAQGVRDAVTRMVSLDQQGVFSNATTGPVTFISNLMQAANLPLSEKMAAKLGNTESYNAVATEAWQKLVSQYGGNRGVTKEEAEQIKTILPQTKNSPQARQQLYTILGNVAERTINQFRVSNKAFGDAVRADDPGKWTDHFETLFSAPDPGKPAVTPSGGDTPVPLDVYLQQKRKPGAPR